MANPRLWALAALILSFLLGAASWSNAQDGRRGFQGGGFGGFGGLRSLDRMVLIGSEEVQKEISIRPDQKAQIDAILQTANGQERALRSGLRDLPPGKRRAKMAELQQKRLAIRTDATGQIQSLLDHTQSQRLDEIFLQISGPAALVDKDIAGRLGVSDDQSGDIQAIFTERDRQRRQLFQGGFDVRPEERGRLFGEMRELMASADSKALQVLSSEQQQAFEKLKGDHFEIDRRRLFRGRRGSGGRGRPSEPRVRPPLEE